MTQENLDATNNPTPFGKGVKQRDLIKMTPEEIEAFLFEWQSITTTQSILLLCGTALSTGALL